MEYKICLKAFILHTLKYDSNFLFNFFNTEWLRHSSTKEASSAKQCSVAGKISPSIFELEQKTKFFRVLYKIISGSTKGN